MDVLLTNQTSHYQDDPNHLWVEIDRGLCEFLFDSLL